MEDALVVVLELHWSLELGHDWALQKDLLSYELLINAYATVVLKEVTSGYLGERLASTELLAAVSWSMVGSIRRASFRD